jgi:hypothetical protein
MNKFTILFDQFSRYQALCDIIEKCGKPNGTLLDIGSGPECLLGFFIQNQKITYLDPLVKNRPEQNIIQGDIFSSDLPKLGTFDCVCAIDVYEHVHPSVRYKFLDELCKYSNNLMIIAFPDSDDSVAINLDKKLNDQYRSVAGEDYIWLREHLDYSLPSAAETISYLNAKGWNCQQVGHGYAPWLEKMLTLTIFGWDYVALKSILLKMSSIFNKDFYAYDFNPPHYRKFIICTRNHDSYEFKIPNLLIDDAANERFNSLIINTYEDYIKITTNVLLSPGGFIAENNRLEYLIKLKDLEIIKFSSELERVYESRSWRITTFLRAIQKIKIRLF